MNIAVIGNGGHSKVICDLIHELPDMTVRAILDDKFETLESQNGMYTAPVSLASYLRDFFKDLMFVIAIGDNRTRYSIAEQLGLDETNFAPPLIHPRSYVSSKATIGRGTVVMAGSVIQADATIGSQVIINTSSSIDHDCVVGSYAHVAPGAVLTGNVTVENGSFIGAGAVVIPGKRIGEWTTVGAGATVVRDLPKNCTAVGTPAKVISFYKLGDETNVTRNHS